MRKIKAWLQSPAVVRRLINLYPPFMGAGIRVTDISPDFRHLRVAMKLRWYNRNYVNTHFGGSLFAMTDPFFMLMYMRILGRDYLVWDAGASIEFVQPGRGQVYVDFNISEDMLNEVYEKTAQGEKFLPRYNVEIRNEQREVVARVNKTLYVRRKANRAT